MLVVYSIWVKISLTTVILNVNMERGFICYQIQYLLQYVKATAMSQNSKNE